jgi:hypothetical protein
VDDAKSIQGRGAGNREETADKARTSVWVVGKKTWLKNAWHGTIKIITDIYNYKYKDEIQMTAGQAETNDVTILHKRARSIELAFIIKPLRFRTPVNRLWAL